MPLGGGRDCRIAEASAKHSPDMTGSGENETRSERPQRLESVKMLSSSQNRPIMRVVDKHRHAGEYDQNPRSKASVPKESVDHRCDSSVETI